MNKKDCKIGMKVVPHSKNVSVGLKSYDSLSDTNFTSLNDCFTWSRAKYKKQGFLYVHGFETVSGNGYDQDVAVLTCDPDAISGDYFAFDDFDLYIE